MLYWKPDEDFAETIGYQETVKETVFYACISVNQNVCMQLLLDTYKIGNAYQSMRKNKNNRRPFWKVVKRGKRVISEQIESAFA